MNITTIICTLAEIRDQLIPVIKDEFSVSQEIAEDILDGDLQPHFNNLKDTTYILLEYPYVDKIYRDSYYSYFSTKLGNYKKDCIRLSFFEGEVQAREFREEVAIHALQSRYRGYMVLRPTVPNVVGRSIISPLALKRNDFLSVSGCFHATVNSIKFQVDGFPHSSQDTETITCAETALWAVMEYFSARYLDYRPTLPSLIVSALKNRSVERQIPSRGLPVEQLGYALKEFGFGSRIYSKDQFGADEFKRLISTYIESGLPLILAVDNLASGGTIIHAILAIGHAKTTNAEIDNLPPANEYNPYLSNIIATQQLKFYDNDDIQRDFVLIDDNQPAYQLSKLDRPTIQYSDPDWHTCEINYFVVPLYPKIYLEAYEAKSYFKQLLLSGYFTIPQGSEIFIRTFLTSSRSYKDALARDQRFTPIVKDFILEAAMPKFIWVGEVSTKDLIKQGLANGILILDATEPNLHNFNALIIMMYQDVYCYPDNDTKELMEISLSLNTFNMYTNNLKGF